MNKKRAFLILTPGFAASEADSTCLPMQQQFARAVSKLYPGVEVIIISFHYPFQRSAYNWFGITVISLAGKNKGGIWRWFLRKKAVEALQKIHEEKEIIGLLSFWMGECALTGKSFADRNHLKHYCWILGQDARKENKYVKRVKPQPGELIALSDFLQNEFEKNHGIKPAFVIPPGIDLPEIENGQRDIDLLGVGSLIPLKRFRIFIEAVAEIKKQLPLVKAMLIGKGPEMKKLAEQMLKMGVSENIILRGEIPYKEALNAMARSKILLHPSSYEGFSGVCMEALSAGAKVISFVKPLRTEITNWQIVKTKEEMVKKAIGVLTDHSIRYEPVVYQSMEGAVQKMMQLFLRS